MSIIPEMPPKLYQLFTALGLAVMVALFGYGMMTADKLGDKYEPIVKEEFKQQIAMKEIGARLDTIIARYKMPRAYDTLAMREWLQKNDSLSRALILDIVFPMYLRLDTLKKREDSLIVERAVVNWSKDTSLVSSAFFNVLFFSGFLMFMTGFVEWSIAEMKEKQSAKKKTVLPHH